MTSHYPTTAELRAFRGRLMSAPSVVAEDPSADGIRTWIENTWQRGQQWRSHPASGGAWFDEATRGIGARDRDLIRSGVYIGRIPGCVEAGDRAGRMRREAAALRSRAFAVIAAEAPGDAGLALDLDAAMDVFEPR